MTDEELDRIEALAKAATPGPWYVIGDPWDDGETMVNAGDDDPHGGTLICDTDMPPWTEGDENLLKCEDAAFIASARTDVPALVAEVRRLREELAALRPDADEAYRPRRIDRSARMMRRR